MLLIYNPKGPNTGHIASTSLSAGYTYSRSHKYIAVGYFRESTWGIPKSRGYYFGCPHYQDPIYGGLHWGRISGSMFVAGVSLVSLAKSSSSCYFEIWTRGAQKVDP